MSRSEIESGWARSLSIFTFAPSAPHPNDAFTNPHLEPCELCGRITRRGTTKHHLIPRRCHHNKWFKKRFSRMQMQKTISVCHDCHGSIHHSSREKNWGDVTMRSRLCFPTNRLADSLLGCAERK